jgi:hypothetical protein
MQPGFPLSRISRNAPNAPRTTYSSILAANRGFRPAAIDCGMYHLTPTQTIVRIGYNVLLVYL